MKIDFPTQDLDKLRHFLCTPRRVVLLGHVSPDGDAVGSTLALSATLRALGHQTTVIYPTGFAESLSFLTGASEAVIAKDDMEDAVRAIEEAEGLFCLDFNEPKRVEQLAPYLERFDRFRVLIDHHPYPDDFADLTFSFPDRSSTCFIVYQLIREMGWLEHLTVEAATAIYTGMMTDTGNFAYNSEDPEIYTVISELLEIGIHKDQIYEAINRSYTIDKLQLNAHLLSDKMTLFPQYKTAIITVSMADKGKYNYQTGDIEGLVNEPLSAREIEFSILIHEMSKYTKISLRSKGDFPVNEFASKFFNGGGHTNAAGAEVFDTLSKTYKLVEMAIRVLHPDDRVPLSGRSLF